MTCQVFLSAKAQRDIDGFSDKITNQILADCTRLADDPIPDGKRIKKLQGFKEVLYRLRAGDYRVVFRLAEDTHDVDASAGSLEHHAIVACSQPVQGFSKPLQLLDPFSVRDGITCEASTIGENLIGDFFRKPIEVSLGLR